MRETVQIPTWLAHIFESGEATLSISDVKTLQLKAKNKKIDFNVIDKELTKDILRSGIGAKGGSLTDRLRQLEKIAKELRAEGLTVTVSYKGDIALTLGVDAKPKLSQLVTRTEAIEINNLSKLTQLVV